MNVDRLVLTFAGIFVLGSLVLSKISSPLLAFIYRVCGG